MGLPTDLQNALAKLKQGPVQAVFDAGLAGETEIFVRGGVSPAFARGLEAVETDIVGTYDLVSTGDGLTLEVKAEEDSMSTAAVVFADQAVGDDYAGFGKTAGKSSRDSAKSLRIRPWQTRTSSALQLEIWKVVPEGDAQKSMTKDEPWAWTQSFRALPDLAKQDGQLLAKMTLPDRA